MSERCQKLIEFIENRKEQLVKSSNNEYISSEAKFQLELVIRELDMILEYCKNI